MIKISGVAKYKANTLSFVNAFFYCWKIAWKASPFYSICRLSSGLVTSSVGFVNIFLSKALIDLLASPNIVENPSNTAVLILIAMTTTQIIRVCLNKLSQYFNNIHNKMISNKLSLDLTAKMLDIDMEYFDSPDYHNAMMRVEQDIFLIPNIVWDTFDLATTSVSVVIAIYALSTKNYFYVLLILISFIPTTIINQKYIRTLYFWSVDHTPEMRKMTYIKGVASNRIHAEDVRLFGLKSMLLKRYSNLWGKYFENQKNILRKSTLMTMILDFIPEIVMIFILINLTVSIISGFGTVGDYSLYSGLVAQMMAGCTMLIQYAAGIYENRLCIESVNKINKFENRVLDEGQRKLMNFESMQFENVYFKYPGTENYVIKNLSFCIEKNKKICMVGVNGAGKSTIVKLILRFYDVDEGRILINGIDVREYTLESLRRIFTTQFQSTSNYAFSFRDNITISDLDRDASDFEIVDALRKADGAEILKYAKQNIDTYNSKLFDEDGIELSGGQKHKLSMARALFRECQFVILDEPTSSLDPESELAVFTNMMQLWENKTAIFISHRFSSVHYADKIMLIENGTLKEYGSHDELMQTNGRYRYLYSLQADQY
ncbi:ABC transporter ATP-binding protein/permease [Eubacteriales bacterium OttesenSCG-928-N14]|nr:ABC transporter ATP-binding protein/permease [Eubacteriales bacterium OttesenSCG-928-N14]